MDAAPLSLAALTGVACLWLILHELGVSISKIWTRIKEILFMYVGSVVFNRENLCLGEGSRWSLGCHFNCDGGLSIGKNVLIGPHVIIHSSNHNYSDIFTPIKQQGHTYKPVRIEDDVWIGANTVILAGVTLHRGCIVGAGSVVNHDVPEYCVAVGNPCHVIKIRGGNKTLKFTDLLGRWIRESNFDNDAAIAYLADIERKEVTKQ